MIPRELLLNNPYLFKFSLKKLEEKDPRVSAMAELCIYFPEFNHLRLLKEGFERIYDCDNRRDAEQLYNEWTNLVSPTGSNQIKKREEEHGVKAELFSKFRVFRNAMNKWSNEVFNYFDANCEYTNAVAEGTNCLIQRMNSMGNGYSFERLRARALFWHEAAPRIICSFEKRYIPKRRTDTTRTGSSAFVMGLLSFNSDEYVDVVACTEQKRTYNPVSVIVYLKAEEKGKPELFID